MHKLNRGTASPKKGHMRSSRMRGFSLLEMAIVLAIMIIVSSITFLSLQPALKDSHVNSAYNLTLMTMRQARQTAVDSRKTYIVTFVAPQTIQVWRQNGAIPPAAAPPPVLINTYVLPRDVNFSNVSGIPTTATTTPDGFGAGSFPVDFDVDYGGGVTSVYFKPDGGAYDNLGRLNNGVLYLARPTELYSSRAITLYGLTSQLRGWRLYKNAVAGTSEWKPL